MGSKRPIILAIFVLSGAAALIDEIVWSRQLVLVFGNTTQAVSAILAGFFGGIAVGSFVGGRVADRVRVPLRMYAVLELVLAVVVLLTPISFRLINSLYRDIYPSIEGSPQVLAVLRVGLAVLALAPATVLMGATLPTLTRQFARDVTLAGAFSRLYAANTIGAIVGTLVAGYVLIELFGLSGALAVGAGCSAVAGVAALYLARGASTEAPEPTAPEGAAPEVAAPATAPAPDPAAASVAADPPRRASRVPALALGVAFISGLTSLGYQVTWTRLLASGTGNTTYVFTTILATFLLGLAIGAVLFATLRTRLGDPIRLLAASQLGAAILAILGLVFVLVAPQQPTPNQPLDTLVALLGSSLLVVLPVTICLGVAFPASSALLPNEVAHAGEGSGALLAVNTVGAIAGSLLVPFVLIPLIGSPALVAGLAAVNAAVAIPLGWRIGWRRRPATTATPGAPATASRTGDPAGRVIAIVSVGVLAAIVATAVSPGVLVQPGAAWVESVGGTVFASTEDEIASVQAGQVSSTPELWVTGTSMTLLTVDAKLMPILPVIARPASTRALVVAFGMGSAFRGALIAGLRTDAVELVPSVPDMFGWYYPDAAAVLANPAGRVIITDGRNHLELTDDRFDIIVTDPPPPIESSGAAVISSKEYYEAGRDHLTDGGIMMQWTPYGGPANEFLDHIRTFATVFPEVTLVKGAGGYGVYMLGSSRPVAFAESDIREVLARPGVLEDISSAYDSPAHTVDGWVSVIAQQTWLTGDAVTAAVGEGPLVTDDRPRPEYFLLRRLFGSGLP
jgi:spermidine synthase